MKKTISIIAILTIISIFALFTYNSKRIDYNTNIEFYKSDFNGKIAQIIEGRGTKIYYNPKDYFYTDFCENAIDIEKIIRVGDVVKKKDSIIKFYRVDNDFNNTEIFSSKVIKPEDTYFSYFFN